MRFDFGICLDAAGDAIGFVSGRSRFDLDHHRQLVLALVKSIEIGGEAANKFSAVSRMEFTEIPWPDIVGMRHRMVHANFYIDHDVLWDTVELNLRPLIKALEADLKNGH